MCYNVENLFDTEDDTITNDEEFLPGHDRYWSVKRLKTKYAHIYQVITAVGEGSLPVIVGLCEVENQHVLDGLLWFTPLGKFGYQVVHKESPDQRGVDVALLYRADVFKPISYHLISINCQSLANDSLLKSLQPCDTTFRTRDVLHVKGVIAGDTLHFFVNHWPSKYGGALESELYRNLAATIVKTYTDSLLARNPQSKIVLMGDFNDSPTDPSVLEALRAAPFAGDVTNDYSLYNVAYPLAEKGKGSHKYQGKWDLLDQIIVSRQLLVEPNPLRCHTNNYCFHIFEAGFLLEEDKKYLGKKPFRTYVGFKYHKGFSDHLPVYLDLIWGS